MTGKIEPNAKPLAPFTFNASAEYRWLTEQYFLKCGRGDPDEELSRRLVAYVNHIALQGDAPFDPIASLSSEAEAEREAVRLQRALKSVHRSQRKRPTPSFVPSVKTFPAAAKAAAGRRRFGFRDLNGAAAQASPTARPTSTSMSMKIRVRLGLNLIETQLLVGSMPIATTSTSCGSARGFSAGSTKRTLLLGRSLNAQQTKVSLCRTVSVQNSTFFRSHGKTTVNGKRFTFATKAWISDESWI